MQQGPDVSLIFQFLPSVDAASNIPDAVSPETPNGYFPASATSPSAAARGKARRALVQDKSPGEWAEIISF